MVIVVGANTTEVNTFVNVVVVCEVGKEGDVEEVDVVESVVLCCWVSDEVSNRESSWVFVSDWWDVEVVESVVATSAL